MSNGFIAVAVAHDYTCPKGEEWLFHGIPKASDANLKPGQPPSKTDFAGFDWLMVFLMVVGVMACIGLVALIVYFLK